MFYLWRCYCKNQGRQQFNASLSEVFLLGQTWGKSVWIHAWCVFWTPFHSLISVLCKIMTFLPNSVASDIFKSPFIHVCYRKKTGETGSFSKSLYYSLHFNVIQLQDSIFQFLFDCSLHFKLWFAFKLVLASIGSSRLSFRNWKHC